MNAILAEELFLRYDRGNNLQLQCLGTTMSEMPRLVSVPTAAESADVSRNTMLLAAKSGKIRAVRLGRDWLIYEDDIERWKQENYQPTMSRKKSSASKQDIDLD